MRGVNAAIDLSRDRLPVEFQLAGFRPEPWTPETCLTRMAGFGMTLNANLEVWRAKLGADLGWKLADAACRPSRRARSRPSRTRVSTESTRRS